MMRRNLVISLIKGYTYFHVKLFVESIRKFAPETDICLFYHSSTDQRTLRRLEAQDVILEPFTMVSPYSQQLPLEFVKSMPKDLIIYLFRHFMYCRFVQGHEQEYDHIFIADARDLVFQKNVFEFPFEKPLNFFLEDKKVGNCSLNSRWVSEQFGQQALREIADQFITCAGTTIGKSAAVKHYLQKMIEYTLEIEKPIMDQGVHNYLVHTNKFDVPIGLHDNETGPICTMHYTSKYKLNDGEVTDLQGRVYDVLHQYDRHPALVNHFNGIYFKSNVELQFQSLVSKVINYRNRKQA